MEIECEVAVANFELKCEIMSEVWELEGMIVEVLFDEECKVMAVLLMLDSKVLLLGWKAAPAMNVPEMAPVVRLEDALIEELVVPFVEEDVIIVLEELVSTLRVKLFVLDVEEDLKVDEVGVVFTEVALTVEMDFVVGDVTGEIVDFEEEDFLTDDDNFAVVVQEVGSIDDVDFVPVMSELDFDKEDDLVLVVTELDFEDEDLVLALTELVLEEDEKVFVADVEEVEDFELVKEVSFVDVELKTSELESIEDDKLLLS